MLRNNPEILFKSHLKIYVLLKDKITFESELEKNNVEYYCDIENQPITGNGIRYFIKDVDKKKLDKIVIENEIIASTETILISDYRDGKKVQKLYFKVAGIIFAIMILIIIIERIVK